MTLVRAFGFHWHAVQREVLGLGRRAADMFTPHFTAAEVLSMIVAPSTTSALRYEMSGGLTTTDHLLATLSEQQAGLVTLTKRYPRPGVSDVDTRPSKPPDINNPDEPVQHIAGDTMTIEQFEARMRAHQGG